MSQFKIGDEVVVISDRYDDPSCIIQKGFTGKITAIETYWIEVDGFLKGEPYNNSYEEGTIRKLTKLEKALR